MLPPVVRPSATVSPSAYQIAGRRFDAPSDALADAVAEAHAAHHRPRCLCQPGGIEMYIARLGAGYIVKRMPETGHHHAAECPSYDPPGELSGLGQALGSAIVEDPATGETTLKLDFPLTKLPGRATMPPAGLLGDGARMNGQRLSLRGLLHYLWDQAELTRWRSTFDGKRSWSTVRSRLLHAAEGKLASGAPLRSRLYIPEVFSLDRREELQARRQAQWAHALARPGHPQRLMLMIAEIKEIAPTRYGHKAVIKHVPDQALAMDDHLYRSLQRRFASELELWGSTESLHLIMMGLLGVNANGIATLGEIALMLVTPQWIPVADVFELQLVQRLIQEGRSFAKSVRVAHRAVHQPVSAVLLDAGSPPVPLCIVLQGADSCEVLATFERFPSCDAAPVWIWDPGIGALPKLPTALNPRTVATGK